MVCHSQCVTMCVVKYTQRTSKVQELYKMESMLECKVSMFFLMNLQCDIVPYVQRSGCATMTKGNSTLTLLSFCCWVQVAP